MNKKILVGGLLSIVVIAAVAFATNGFGLFTAKSHFNVQEGIQVQYWTGSEWLPLTVTGDTFDLGQATILPGETNSFLVRAQNIASNGAIGLELNIGAIDGLSHDVSCYGDQSTGLEYTKRTNQYYFKVASGAGWKVIQIDTVASGDIGTGSITFDNVLTRTNALSSYEATC